MPRPKLGNSPESLGWCFCIRKTHTSQCFGDKITNKATVLVSKQISTKERTTLPSRYQNSLCDRGNISSLAKIIQNHLWFPLLPLLNSPLFRMMPKESSPLEKIYFLTLPTNMVSHSSLRHNKRPPPYSKEHNRTTRNQPSPRRNSLHNKTIQNERYHSPTIKFQQY